jgi:uncharacterized membrane protein YbhN (UPF0104 family)
VLSSIARSPPLVFVVLVGGVVALVALGSLVGLGTSVNAQAILAVHVGWWWLVLAAAVNLVSILAKGAVWKAALEPVRAVGRVTWRAVVSAMFVGFLVNTVLAARVGEVARVAVLKRRLRLEGLDVRFATIAGTVVAEQVVLGLALVLFVGSLALVVPLPGWVGWSLAGVATLLAVAGLALGLAVWSSRRRSGPAARTGASRFTRLVEALMAGQAVFGRPRLAAVALGASLVSWVAQVLAILLTLDAFGIHRGLAAAALVFVATTLASLFPVLPASIGIFQGAVSVVLVSAYGVAPAVALAFSVALQLVEMVFGVGLGVAFLAAEGLSLQTTRTLIAHERH